jgi:anti-anti-sigma regulatory factor
VDERPFGAALQPDGTLLVSGSVDELSVDDFRAHLRQCLEASATPCVDLSDVDFLPSLAVGVLVGALQHDPPELTVVARKGCIAAKVLNVCGIEFTSREDLPQPQVS